MNPASKAREVWREGGGLEDNPFPPGTKRHKEFKDAFTDIYLRDNFDQCMANVQIEQQQKLYGE